MTENMWIQFVLPIVTALLGWLASAYRNKQKKENDTIANFQLMRDADKEFMTDLKNELIESKNLRKRLEAKLDRKTNQYARPIAVLIPMKAMVVLFWFRRKPTKRFMMKDAACVSTTLTNRRKKNDKG